ncbi:hypothetical protein Unana1_08131 [Umbelopsis nana]
MYIKTLAVLSLAIAAVLADTSSATDQPTATTSAPPSHVSGVPIAITPSGLPDCTSTAARHACPGIAIICPAKCPDTCYLGVTNACCPGTGNIVCSLSELSNSTTSGAHSSASLLPSAVTSASNTASGAAPSGNSSAAASSGAQASKSSASQTTFQASILLAAGAGAVAVMVTNL